MIVVERMSIAHVEAVHAIELESFSIAWSKQSFVQELTKNKLAFYFVAKDVDGKTDKVVGYAGLWHVVTEGHVTNVAVAPACRGKGIGSMLVERILAFAVEKDMIGVTLEVRVGNKAALSLYKRHGFLSAGIRKNYYTDTGEDAIVMWRYLKDFDYLV